MPNPYGSAALSNSLLPPGNPIDQDLAQAWPPKSLALSSVPPTGPAKPLNALLQSCACSRRFAPPGSPVQKTLLLARAGKIVHPNTKGAVATTSSGLLVAIP